MLTRFFKFGNECHHRFYLSLDVIYKKHFGLIGDYFTNDSFDESADKRRFIIKSLITGAMYYSHEFGEFCQRKLYKASDREIQDLDHYTALLIRDLLIRFKQIKGVENIQTNLLIDINEIINCFSVENGLSRYRIKQGFDLFAKNCNDFYF